MRTLSNFNLSLNEWIFFIPSINEVMIMERFRVIGPSIHIIKPTAEENKQLKEYIKVRNATNK